MKSIRRTLVSWLLAGLTIVWGLAGTSLYYVVRKGEEERFDRGLRRAVQFARVKPFFVESPDRRDGRGDRDGRDGRDGRDDRDDRDGRGDRDRDRDDRDGGRNPRMPDFGAPDSGFYFQLWGQDGEVVFRSESLEGNDLPRGEAPGSDDFLVWNATLENGVPVRIIHAHDLKAPRFSRDRSGGRRRGEGMDVVVAQDRSALRETLTTLVAGIVGAGIAAAAASVALVHFALKRGLAPLKAFGERLSAIDERSLDQRFPAKGLPHELLPVAQKFDGLLARLESGFKRERQFSADLAHELRTPIAELKMLTEVAKKWPDDAAAADTALLGGGEIADQMEAIVDGMLTLSRFQGGSQELLNEAVDLGAVARECWGSHEKTAAARNLTLDWQIAPGASPETDPRLLRTIVANLLSNAATYTPDGGTIRATAPESGNPVFQISNPAPGFAAEDLEKMFDRLWRGDSARASTGHFGLGLPLARACAEAAGMNLDAELQNGTLVFSLTRQGTR